MPKRSQNERLRDAFEEEHVNPPRRVVFALEQVLGHISLAQSIKRFAPQCEEIAPTFVDIMFYKQGGLIERSPLPDHLKGALRARLELRAALRNGMPDAFFFNTQKPAVLCQDYVRRVPAVISLDVTPAQYDRLARLYDHRADRAGPVRAAKHAANRRLFHAAAHLLPWSHWVEESLIRDYGVPAERISVIPPGADVERWQPGVRREDGRVRILFVGGNFKRKGGDLLLDWFRNSPDAEACALHLVTRDPVPPAARVHVHRGVQNNSDELIALARSADIFVLPTLADCFSIASVEAMAAGLPVVTTNVGGISDIVERGRNGFLIEPGDRLALAQALHVLVHDAGLRRRMGNAGRARAEAHFSARLNTARIVREIQTAIDTASSREGGVRTSVSVGSR